MYNERDSKVSARLFQCHRTHHISCSAPTVASVGGGRKRGGQKMEEAVRQGGVRRRSHCEIAAKSRRSRGEVDARSR